MGSPEWWAAARELAAAAAGPTDGGERNGEGAGGGGGARARERAAGDLAALARPFVLRLVATRFPYRGDAEDVTQNVCLSVLRQAGSLRDPTRVRPWLVAIALNECRTFYRRQQAEGERRRRAGAEIVPEVQLPRLSVLAGHRIDLLDALDRLPRHQAFALGLRQFELGYEEIAAEMSTPERLAALFDQRTDPVPVGSVKRWVHDGRRVVQAATGVQGDDGGDDGGPLAPASPGPP